ncbi:hypothetical protein HDV06_004644 [Boothiomyces sp. JEL0866]|nr:hypothetical protein HDV06_004644 [Boothiomyces sp. JEL0866]
MEDIIDIRKEIRNLGDEASAYNESPTKHSDNFEFSSTPRVVLRGIALLTKELEEPGSLFPSSIATKRTSNNDLPLATSATSDKRLSGSLPNRSRNGSINEIGSDIVEEPTNSARNSVENLNPQKSTFGSIGSLTNLFKKKTKAVGIEKSPSGNSISQSGSKSVNSLNQSKSNLYKSELNIKDDDSRSVISELHSESQFEVSPTGNDAFKQITYSMLSTSNISIMTSIKWRDQAISMKLTQSKLVSEIILEIVHKLQSLSTANAAALDEYDHSMFLLGKKDRYSPGMQSWLNPDYQLITYDIQQGDDLLLKHATDVGTLLINAPPATDNMKIKYDFDCSVAETIKVLRNRLQFDSNVTCGLYHPRLGMWLDSQKTLFSYDLDHNVPIEFRVQANEFLLRISLLDFDQKIGIKVLPTFRVSDVLAIINYQLLNRKLLPTKKGRYGLYVPSSKSWMRGPAQIDEYSTIKTEILEFSIQHELCQIAIGEEIVNLYVDSTCTVHEVVSLLQINNDITIDKKYTLVKANREYFKENDLIWTALKEMSVNDIFYLEPVPEQYSFTCKSYPDFTFNCELNSSKTMQEHIPIFAMKFGFPESSLKCILLDENSLDLNIPISKLDLPIDSKMELVFSGDFTENMDELNRLSVTQTNAFVQIKTSTLDNLVKTLTGSQSDGSVAYLDFIKTFLLTYQSFIDAQSLLKKLIKRYSVLNVNGCTWSEFEKIRKPIELRVCNVLLQWIKKFPFDFMHPIDGINNCNAALAFVDQVITRDHPQMAKQMRKNLTKMRDGHTLGLKKGLSYKSHKEEMQGEAGNIIIFGYSPEDIANQLTLVESGLFTEIIPSELLNQAWAKKEAHIKAPGIIALTRRFNSVACWCAQSILNLKTPKARGERLGKIIDIANFLAAKNNYSTLMAIIAGINKACISRLKLTAREVNPKYTKRRAELETLMSAQSSYKNYRVSIHSIAPPCIPYIGTYLTDLTYIEDGNPDLIDGLINFSKKELISKVIREIMEYQQFPYTIKPHSELIACLSSIPEASEELEKQMWTQSKSLE